MSRSFPLPAEWRLASRPQRAQRSHLKHTGRQTRRAGPYSRTGTAALRPECPFSDRRTSVGAVCLCPGQGFAFRRRVRRVSQLPSRGEPRDDFSAGSQRGRREFQTPLPLTAASILLARAAAAADRCASFTRLRMAEISSRYSSRRAMKVRRSLVQTSVCGEPERTVTWVMSSLCRSIT